MVVVSAAEDSQGWERGEMGRGADGVSGLFVRLGVVAGNLEDNETLTTLTASTLPIR